MSIVNITVWLGVAIGVFLLIQGCFLGRLSRAVAGVSVASYSMGLSKWAPLGVMAGNGHSITIDDRIAGTTWTFIGGAALTTLVAGIQWVQTVTAASENHTFSPRSLTANRQLSTIWAVTFLGILAVHAVTALPGQPLLPTDDFLNVYGGDYRAALSQVLMFVSLGVPPVMLCVMAIRHHTGAGRLVYVVAAAFGVLWGVWKIGGISLRFIFGIHIPHASPTSVSLATLALGFLAGGFIVTTLDAWIRDMIQASILHKKIKARDAQHYKGGNSETQLDPDGPPVVQSDEAVVRAPSP